MRVAFAIVPALLLGTSLGYAADKQNLTGQNKNLRTLSEVNSIVPSQQNERLQQLQQQANQSQNQNQSQQGQQIRQITETWTTTTNNPDFNNSIAVAIEQQQINGSDITVKGWGMNKSPRGDEWFFTWEGNGRASGPQEASSQGQFQFTGGTGKYQNAKGGGSFKCQGNTTNPMECDWQGQIELQQ